ncbi:MAG: hypothetical protein LBS28_03955 [Streptococcaceae bacterium]|jgi:regulator of replication initiation timing|nr:hypothetical protein [Streptococcaceae bacterium]
MDEKTLYDKLTYIESSLELMLTEIYIIKKAMRKKLKKEVDLSLENQKLKTHLLELEHLINNKPPLKLDV